MMLDHAYAPMELKLADRDSGRMTGYGAVFGNRDSHGDVIMPGAFDKVMAEHKAAGTMPTMYLEHGPALGGDPLPAGVWNEMQPDDKGLKLDGKISALDTDYGRRVRSLVADKALTGLSIGFQVGPGNSVKTKDGGRQINSFDHLREVSLVTHPSNGSARVDSIKAMMGFADKDKATAAIAGAIAVHRAAMAGGDSPTKDERDAMLSHLQDAHEALTGQRMPQGQKSAPTTLRELEAALREIGLSRSQAAQIAEGGFKTAILTSGEGGPAGLSADLAAEISGLRSFTLPIF